MGADGQSLRWSVAQYVAQMSSESSVGEPEDLTVLFDIAADMLTRVAEVHPLRQGLTPKGLARFLGAMYFGLLMSGADERFDATAASALASASSQFLRRAFEHDESGFDVPAPVPILGPLRKSPAGPPKQLRTSRQELADLAAELLLSRPTGNLDASDVARASGLTAVDVGRHLGTKDELTATASAIGCSAAAMRWESGMKLLGDALETIERSRISALLAAIAVQTRSDEGVAERLDILRSLVLLRSTAGGVSSSNVHLRRFEASAINSFAVLERRGLLASDIPAASAACMVAGGLFGQIVIDGVPRYDVPAEEWSMCFTVLIDEVLLANR